MLRGLVALACFSNVASAKPPTTCTAGGPVVLTIRQGVDAGVKLATSKTIVYGNGAWHTEIRDRDGVDARSIDGCLESTELLHHLGDVRWELHPADTLCHVVPGRYTVYRWHKRVLFTERTCNAEVLDRDSRHMLDQLAYALHLPALDDAIRDCSDNPLAPGCH